MSLYRVILHYHDVPDYEVDSATSVISSTMLKFLLKALFICFGPAVKNGVILRKIRVSSFFDAFNPVTRRMLLWIVTVALLKYEALLGLMATKVIRVLRKRVKLRTGLITMMMIGRAEGRRFLWLRL